MTEFAKTMQTATNRGTAFLDDIAGTVAQGKGNVENMLGDICRDVNDWACIFVALGAWDSGNANVNEAIANIIEAAKAYCDENRD